MTHKWIKQEPDRRDADNLIEWTNKGSILG